MKLCKTLSCLEATKNLFEQQTDDFQFASALCDLISEIETQAEKYTTLRQKLLSNTKLFIQNKDGTYEIKEDADKNEIDRLTTDLNNLEFKFKKVTVNKPKTISPKEFYYLKEFFDFV